MTQDLILDKIYDIRELGRQAGRLIVYVDSDTISFELAAKISRLTCTYPEYGNGWKVTAEPDGMLTDASGMQYNYLYWEGITPAEYDFAEGFCVAGKDTAAFLEVTLEKLGLSRREANEFIVYWLPMMEGNACILISFQTDIYTENAKLDISPEPDTLIRVFMAWKPLNTPVKIPVQEFETVDRTGFTVVEWSGARVD